MKTDELYYVLYEQKKDFDSLKNFVPREKTDKILDLIKLKLPIIITGVRRCGKSSLMSLIKDKLSLKDKEYLYINFNDERMVDFSIEDFQKILDFMNENDYIKKCILFLDEVQEVNGWEKWVDRIRQKHQIFITGSNSKLLSKEISTILTGRSISINLFPFSFIEILNAKNIDLINWKVDLKLRLRIKKEFKEYLNGGGFPQKVITNEKIIVSELYENMLYRDIIKRFNKNMTKQIKEISLYLLSNVSSDVSLRTLSNISGITNLSTIKEIIDSFEEGFLFFSIHKYDYSVKKQILNPRKIYCVDNGFPSIVGFKFSEDKGKLLENLVAIELRRRGKEIFYHRENKECDLVIKKGLKIIEAIQVCYDLNDGNQKREIEGLIEAMEKFGLKRGLILTFDQEKDLKVSGKKIEIRSVWKWLLEDVDFAC